MSEVVMKKKLFKAVKLLKNYCESWDYYGNCHNCIFSQKGKCKLNNPDEWRIK